MGSNPASKPGHPDDRWMVSFSAHPRESLGMPFMLAYTVVVYWVFRGKVRIGRFSY